MKRTKGRDRNELPAGWDQERVKAVIDHYDSQSADEEDEEITRLLDESDFRVMRIPVALVPEVEKLLKRSRGPDRPRRRGAVRSRGPGRARAA